MRNRTWTIAMAASSALLIAGGIAGIAGIANSDPNPDPAAYVDGYGEVTDDFSDHEREAGVLCEGCDNSSDTDLVTLWQAIMVAEDKLALEGMDGVFGTKTAEATEEWQEDNGLEPTGQVDKQSWALADDNLSRTEGEGAVYYEGAEGADESARMEFDRVDGEDNAYMFIEMWDVGGAAMVPSGGASYIKLFEKTFTMEDPS
ncbi:peptidoglycan-binding domain-containing protein [Stackebrandtia nassauensis]|uniref:Peptidoglycan-binding domain 1 protein n=1 Tax=Stackebrandtia nassauensis (strain DSM 44728 / CIP 108903 / NRRL B-16338 / NBRC 102104 / LLR-40K-21) TaxID=446470 RepID=D3PVQ0_STANL|nr:peptidoglycan-binding domain-containing protein [Stackebrandtia nassauensis]ADD43164.1 Peptidoglycan-binding domain 1 protein [Stackebrandtia nassauensis DSM 44728]